MSKIKDTIIDKVNEVENEYKYIDENKAHLHTYLGKPLLGTSTVVGVLSKNLTWWSAELAAVECLESGENIPTIREEYLKAKELGKEGIDALQKKYPIFKKARFAHFVDKNDKAERGTDMHAIMEEYVKRCINENHGIPFPVFDSLENEKDDIKLQNFVNWATSNVIAFLFSEKNVYSDRMWTGGIFDVMFERKDGKICIGDFKSSKEAYLSQFIQIAGYDIQQKENGIFTPEGYKLSDGLNVEAYYIFPFGSDKFNVEVKYGLDELRNGFENCVNLYKLTNE